MNWIWIILKQIHLTYRCDLRRYYLFSSVNPGVMAMNVSTRYMRCVQKLFKILLRHLNSVSSEIIIIIIIIPPPKKKTPINNKISLLEIFSHKQTSNYSLTYQIVGIPYWIPPAISLGKYIWKKKGNYNTL